jgi:hypothetical protein
MIFSLYENSLKQILVKMPRQVFTTKSLILFMEQDYKSEYYINNLTLTV